MLLISNRIPEHIRCLRDVVANELVSGHRFALLVHVYREWSDFLRKWTGYYGHHVAMLELKTGRGSLALNNQQDPVAPKWPELKEIYWVVGNFRICNMAVEAQAELGKFLEKAYLDLLSLQIDASIGPDNLQAKDKEVTEALRHYQHLMERQTKTMNNVGLLRAEAQLDAV